MNVALDPQLLQLRAPHQGRQWLAAEQRIRRAQRRGIVGHDAGQPAVEAVDTARHRAQTLQPAAKAAHQHEAGSRGLGDAVQVQGQPRRGAQKGFDEAAPLLARPVHAGPVWGVQKRQHVRLDWRANKRTSRKDRLAVLCVQSRCARNSCSSFRRRGNVGHSALPSSARTRTSVSFALHVAGKKKGLRTIHVLGDGTFFSGRGSQNHIRVATCRLPLGPSDSSLSSLGNSGPRSLSASLSRAYAGRWCQATLKRKTQGTSWVS